jgi:tetratricopeptide (TPR) repeat protein
MKYYLLLILILSACVSQETKVNSHQSNVHYNLALELAQNALYQNSLDEFTKAISLDPNNMNAYRKKGLVHFGLRQYDEAEKLFVKAISLDPHNAQAHINLGMVKYYTGDKVAAKNLWQKSVNLKTDDNDSKALNNIANLYKEDKNYKKATEYYLLAKNQDSGNTMYLNNLADTLRLQGELEQANLILKNSLKLNPRGVNTNFYIGMVYRDLKEYGKAMEFFKKSLRIASFPEAHFQIAQIEFSMKNRGSALKSIESAIQSSPKNLKYQNFRDIISPS